MDKKAQEKLAETFINLTSEYPPAVIGVLYLVGSFEGKPEEQLKKTREWLDSRGFTPNDAVKWWQDNWGAIEPQIALKTGQKEMNRPVEKKG